MKTESTVSSQKDSDNSEREAGSSALNCSVFSYYDNRGPRHIFLEVEASGILEADAVLKVETGIVAAKTAWVGCAPGREFTFDPMTKEKAEWIEGGGYNYFPQNKE